MRVIEPQKISRRKVSKRRVSTLLALIIVPVVTIYSAYTLLMPYPMISPVTKNYTVEGTPISLTGLSNAQISVATLQSKTVASTADMKPKPMASLAKMVLALCLQKKYAIKPNEAGPSITLTQRDVYIYNSYLAKNGAVVLVKSGEKIALRQALQALLLPSANNMADTLANWAFGSVNAYVEYANAYISELGLRNTKIAGASGFLPDTVSTTDDLTVIAKEVLKDSTLASIVKQRESVITVQGKIYNTNPLVWRAGFIGVKTGNTDQADGCLVSAYETTLASEKVTLIVAVLGDKTVQSAAQTTLKVIDKVKSGYASETIVAGNKTLATISTKSGEKIRVAAKEPIVSKEWKSIDKIVQIDVDAVKNSVADGQVVGRVTYGDKTVELISQDSVLTPNWWWRLKNPAWLL